MHHEPNRKAWCALALPPDAELRKQRFLLRGTMSVIGRCLGPLLALACLGGAQAQVLLVPVNPSPDAGSEIAVTLLLPNDSADEELVFDLPARITLRARGIPGAPDIVLLRADSQPSRARIKPGEFLRSQYSGFVPQELGGDLVLDPVDFAARPLAVSIADSMAPKPAPGRAPASVDALPGDPVSSAIGLRQRDAARFAASFSPYEPNYASMGSVGPTNAKSQVSLKFRLFNRDTKTPILERLYIAYSQTSIWAVGSSSKPLYDSAYRPGVFFLDEEVSQWPFGKLAHLGFQAGIEHESNGRDGAASRSLNIGYVRPTFTVPLAGDYFISVSPKIYGYLEKEDNADIDAYRGYCDLVIKTGHPDGAQVATSLRKGTRKHPYSVQMDLSIPLKTARLGNLGGYLHLQYFNGFGENLLDYDRRVRSQLRIGLMISR